MADRLSAEQWIAAALAALARQSVEAVRVEPLARALGVTKGSFYWHFTDRRALLDAALRHWEEAATDDVIARVRAASEDPAERLRALTRLAFEGGGELDRAVRAWAIDDEVAARTVARVDRRRHAFVQSLFVASGHAPEVASRRARLLYTSLIGEQHTSLRLGRRRRVAWALLNLTLLLEP